MRNLFFYPCFLVLMSTGLAQHAAAQSWELVWADEFDGTTLDLTKWTFQTGDGCPDLCGWGNNELQWYKTENTTVADGFLTITSREEQAGGKNYTSSRIRTINKGDWTYGRFEIRAKMPIGKGLWPAIWMLPTDPSIYGTWAASGEIDIMEYLGDKPNEVLGTIHYGGSWPNNQFSSRTYTLSSGLFSADFHVFAVEWEEGVIRWYVDDVLYATQTDWSSTNGDFPAPFDVDFHLILNMAVGGNLPGNPDASTFFPQSMVVDYVRVYTNNTGTTSNEKFGDLPDGVILDEIYPNPIQQQGHIKVLAEKSQQVKVELFDLLGRQVKSAFDGLLIGRTPYLLPIEVNHLAPGAYVYRITGDTFSKSRLFVISR